HADEDRCTEHPVSRGNRAARCDERRRAAPPPYPVGWPPAHVGVLQRPCRGMAGREDEAGRLAQHIKGGEEIAGCYRLTTFFGRRKRSNSSACRRTRRTLRLSYEAEMNALNRGCGSSGFDLNSGWNWHPRKYACLGISTIST